MNTSQPERKKPRPYRYSGLKPEARRAARREALLEAGIELFGTVGIAETKLTDICGLADLTQRYFYESFASLDEFVMEVARKLALDVGRQIVRSGMQQSTGRDSAHAVLAECAKIVEDDPRVARFLFIESLRAGGELASVRQVILISAANALQMMRDPDADFSIESIMPVFMASIRGEMRGVTVESQLPGAIVMAGATAELFTAWLEGRVKMDRDSITSHLDRLLDFTIDWAESEGPRPLPNIDIGQSQS